MHIVNRDYSDADYNNPFLDRLLAYFLDKLTKNKKYFKGKWYEITFRKWTNVSKDTTGTYLSVFYLIDFSRRSKAIRVDVAYRT